MNKHTPGPWTLTEFDQGWVLGGGAAFVETLYKDAQHADEYRANARLIAAAPELLEALQSALTCMDAGASLEHGAGYEVFRNSPIEKARAAIAKATGGQ